MTSKPIRIHRSWARYRWRMLVLIGLVCAVFAAAVVGVAAIVAASRQAIDDSTAGNQAGRPFVVQTGAGLARTLDATDGFEPIAESLGTIASGSRLVDGTVRVTKSPQLPVATLLDGRRAEQPAEVLVTLATASTLAVHIGDDVEVAAADQHAVSYRVVGVVVDPADRTAQGAILNDADLEPSAVAVWASDHDPASLKTVRTALERRTASYQTLDSALETSDERLPDAIADLKYVPWVLMAGASCVLLGLLLALLPVARGDVAGLQAAGMTARAASSPIVICVAASVLVGHVLGVVGVQASLALARDPLSAAIGQYWLVVPVPWTTTILSLAVVAAGIVVVPHVVAVAEIGQTWRSRRSPKVASGPIYSALALLVGVLVMGAASLGTLSVPPSQVTLAAPLGAVLVAGGLPAFMRRALASRKSRAATRVIDLRLSHGVHGAVTFACIVIAAASSHSAQVSQDSSAFESSTRAEAPSGSLLIDALPDDAAGTLTRRFTDLGGEQFDAYEVPLETDTQLRVTSPDLIRCMSERHTLDPDAVPAECLPTGTYSTINTVVISTTSIPAPSADPALIQGGEVGVLTFPTGSRTASTTNTVAASPGDTLGGHLPGLVLPADPDVLDQYGLQPGGTQIVVLLDFGSLGEQAKASLRSDVARLGPGAQVMDSTGDSAYQRDRVVAAGQAMAAGVLASVILILAAAVVALAHRRTMRVLIDIGTPSRPRVGMALRWAAFPALSILATLPIIVAAAQVAGVGSFADSGYWWAVPPATLLLASVVMPALLLRVPPRLGE